MIGSQREMVASAVGLVAILLWAGLALATVGTRGLPPFEVLALSFAVAFVAGMVLLACRGRAGLAELLQRPAAWLTSFASIFFYHALYFYALSTAPAAEASLIAYLWPLMIVLLSALLPAERLRARHLAGAALGLCGTALILVGKAPTSATVGSLAGYAAALACALVWSAYSVLNRRFSAVPSGMIVGVCGAVALAGWLCHAAAEPTVPPAPSQWLSIVVLGLGPTGLAFLAWDHATKHGRLPLLGALSYLAPLLSTVMLIVAGKAQGSPTLLLAALLIIAGAVTATGLPRREATAR